MTKMNRMGCLISTIVLAAIVAVVYYTWTNFGCDYMDVNDFIREYGPKEE